MLLKEWSKKEGRTLVWIAKKTGIPLHRLYNATAELQNLTDKDIKTLIELTEGKCSYDEIKFRKPKDEGEKKK